MNKKKIPLMSTATTANENNNVQLSTFFRDQSPNVTFASIWYEIELTNQVRHQPFLESR